MLSPTYIRPFWAVCMSFWDAEREHRVKWSMGVLIVRRLATISDLDDTRVLVQWVAVCYLTMIPV